MPGTQRHAYLVEWRREEECSCRRQSPKGGAHQLGGCSKESLQALSVLCWKEEKQALDDDICHRQPAGEACLSRAPPTPRVRGSQQDHLGMWGFRSWILLSQAPSPGWLPGSWVLIRQESGRSCTQQFFSEKRVSSLHNSCLLSRKRKEESAWSGFLVGSSCSCGGAHTACLKPAPAPQR